MTRLHTNYPLPCSRPPCISPVRTPRSQLKAAYYLPLLPPLPTFSLSALLRALSLLPLQVRDKAYYPVVWEEAGQRWRPTGMYHTLLMQMSIFPDARQVCGWGAAGGTVPGFH